MLSPNRHVSYPSKILQNSPSPNTAHCSLSLLPTFLPSPAAPTPPAALFVLQTGERCGGQTGSNHTPEHLQMPSRHPGSILLSKHVPDVYAEGNNAENKSQPWARVLFNLQCAATCWVGACPAIGPVLHSWLTLISSLLTDTQTAHTEVSCKMCNTPLSIGKLFLFM